ncbi:MAG: ABC transporter permease [Candidatus Bathyarchaeota archaeon]|nr:ABC transporter permease [Candidatus Bathyarchaeota archaeon]
MFAGYVGKKIVIALVTLLVVVTLNFMIFRVFVGGDPSQMILDPRMPPEVRDQLLAMWGIDKPLFPDQYSLYLYNLFTWQYGLQFDQSATPIAPEMVWRLRNTVILLGLATIGTISVGIPLGMFAGAKRGKKTDVTVIGIGLLTFGVPMFFLQLIWVAIFCLWLQILPRAGLVGLGGPQDPLSVALDVAAHAISPICTLIVGGFGGWALYTRNMMVDALTEDFVLTARAKGLRERDVITKHAFKSILPPVVTLIALSIPGIVTGAIITESIFAWPGIGQWYISALQQQNHPVTQAVLYNFAVLMLGANLVADLAYGFLDPRIKVGVRR